MSKYSLSFKLEVVQHYLSGQEGQEATAKRFGIDHSAVRKWTAAWKLHGQARLTTRHFTCSPAFSTVCQWERLYDEGGSETLTDSRRRKKMMPERPENHSVPLLQALLTRMNERSLNNCVLK